MRPSCVSQSLSSQSQNSPEIYHSSAEQIHFPQWQEPEITMSIIGYCQKIKGFHQEENIIETVTTGL